MTMRSWMLLVAVAVLGGLAYYAWFNRQTADLPEGFAASNGRIEATEIDVATFAAGRLESVEVREGDFVEVGDVLAQMDTDVLQAQLQEAQAELRRAQTLVQTSQSIVSQRESEKAATEAVVRQREVERTLTEKNLQRAERLAQSNATSLEELDQIRAAHFSSQAALKSAEANVAGADAAISTARSEVIQAEAAVEAAEARILRIQAEIEDATLVATRSGRVQYRIAEPGEVLGAGGRVVNLVDLSDVYMTFFLPTAEAGRLSIGAEARLILDAAPQYVIPAKITYVADVAQFTPKTVETAEERQKLMFQVRAQIDPEILKRYIRMVKTGLPGMAYVRINSDIAWPPQFEVRLPE